MRQGTTLRDSRRPGRMLFSVLMACAAVARAQDDPVPRDPLELRALTEPTAVLDAIPAELDKARAAGDQRRVALLEVARANACRIAADWTCQRDAGLAAREAAQAAGDSILTVRGLIGESRGRIALQEFARGEQLLDEAQSVLREHPLPDLLGDVHLGYSSLYYSLGIPVSAQDRRGHAPAIAAGRQDAVDQQQHWRCVRAHAARCRIAGGAGRQRALRRQGGRSQRLEAAGTVQRWRRCRRAQRAGRLRPLAPRPRGPT